MRISDWSSDVCSSDLVRPCPVTMENFHVPGVRSRTVENLGGPADPAHLFSAQRIFDVGEPLSRKLECVIDLRLTAGRGHEQIPKPGGPGLGLKLLNRSQRLPSIAGREFLCVVLQ